MPGRLRIPGGLGRGNVRMGRGAGMGGLGIIVFIVIALLLGVDPSVLFEGVPLEGPTSSSQRPSQVPRSPQEEELKEFVSVVLADTEDTWRELFRQMNGTYSEPTLVLFSGSVSSACGFAQAAVGPFYCPGDQKVYIDLSFYEDLKNRFQAPGDFAQAYVIAHEIGHHVQTLLGVSADVQRRRRQLSQSQANALSVRQELQADCFAGVWAYHAQASRNILEAGDIEEGLNAASAIGDDRLQRQSRGYVSPESFTHGTSAQRVRWFKRGFENGRLDLCNTFEAARL